MAVQIIEGASFAVRAVLRMPRFVWRQWFPLKGLVFGSQAFKKLSWVKWGLSHDVALHIPAAEVAVAYRFLLRLIGRASLEVSEARAHFAVRMSLYSMCTRYPPKVPRNCIWWPWVGELAWTPHVNLVAVVRNGSHSALADDGCQVLASTILSLAHFDGRFGQRQPRHR